MMRERVGASTAPPPPNGTRLVGVYERGLRANLRYVWVI